MKCGTFTVHKARKSFLLGNTFIQMNGLFRFIYLGIKTFQNYERAN